ncbi:hypothetical protein DFH09DRAFT_1182574 [Mycena vulgaris]|nr:hypothetical protein DFH09DRAFT_1182574 [Mycena vulgaris]
MRWIELSLLQSRLICTLAPPPTTSKQLFVAPPILVAKSRTRMDGSFLLLSSNEPDVPRNVWLDKPRQITRYSRAQTVRATDVSLKVARALRRFVEPRRGTDVTRIGAVWNPQITRKPRLHEMLMACLASPQGVRGLFEADVVAQRDVIKKLMFPHKASFNASFAHGVLFLDEVDDPSNFLVDSDKLRRDLGFLRACTEMYTEGWDEPRSHARHTLHSVVARSLGGLNLLMSGSVDCVKFTDNNDPNCYMQFVTRPLRDGKCLIRSKTWKDWYIRAHLMGIRSLCLGRIDEAGVLRSTSRLMTHLLPREATRSGGPWNPSDNFHWAFRVLTALRDYVWRVDIAPVGHETRVLIRELRADELRPLQPRQLYGIVPAPVIKAYEQGYP